MKRIGILSFVAVLVVACLLVGCRDDVTPMGDKDLPDNQTKYVSVYICGAVQNSGFFKIPEGTDVQTAVLEYARILDNGVLPAYSLEFVHDGDVIIVDYVVGKTRYSVTNVNGMYVVSRLGVDNVETDVINMLADYISANGKIRNNADLRSALGDKYNENFYKFYVSEDDYREDN